jgi:DNA repair protein RecO (recombination protein O)
MSRTAASAPYSTRAIVLRVRPLGEKDRVLTLFSPERGKFSASARGARATKSKLAAISQPFMRGKFMLAHGRSLDILTQGEIERAPLSISGDVVKSAWATYWCELCDALPEDHAESEIWELLNSALEELETRETSSAETIGRWFEARFLGFLGFSPTIGRCVVCDAKIVLAADEVSRRVAFSPIRGGTLCANCVRFDAERQEPSAQALRVWHRLERAESAPNALGGEQSTLSAADARDLRDVLRRSIALHLEVRLRSLRFLDDVTSGM